MSSFSQKASYELADVMLREAVEKMVCLVYVGRTDGLVLPEAIRATVSWLHPSHDITFRITDPAWLARTGWSPGSHVEVQASPFPQGPSADTYYWQHVQTGPDNE